MKHNKQLPKAGLSLLFGVIALLFWGIVYPAHLQYHEQLQLFVSGTDYWVERTAIPGGVAEYIGEFLVQFYYYVWAGAGILALLFVGLQLLVWQLAERQGAPEVYYPLSFVPVICLWRFMGDENVMLSFAIALLMALAACRLYSVLREGWKRIVGFLLLFPLLYWAAGATYFVFMGWVIIRELYVCYRQRALLRGAGVVVGTIVLRSVCMWLTAMYVHQPLYQLTGFVGYYRLPAFIPGTEMTVMLMFTLFSYLMACLPGIRKRASLCFSLQTVLLLAGGYCFIASGCNMGKEEVFDYDRLTRNRQWHRIIEKAELKKPLFPLSVVCLNLALGKTGQLSDRLFDFHQFGTEGLLSKFQLNFFSPLPTGEAYYHLGMIHTAQRFTFEAMEAVPNFRKSVRCLKRLAETSLINGQYEVAAKYLRVLQRTLFYREWAEDAMTYLYNDEKVDTHGEWGELRRMRCMEKRLFKQSELREMLEDACGRNKENRLALEYLSAYTQLKARSGNTDRNELLLRKR